MADDSRTGTAPAPRTANRKHDVSRLEALSDAVFAFAMTLLVVSLEVPKSFRELRSNLQGFVAFAICFGMLVHIWWEHNSFYRRFGLQDPITVLLNSVLLFVVLFFVYPLKFLFTSFVAVYFGIDGGLQWQPEDLASMFVIYGIAYCAVFGSFILLYRHAIAKRMELQLSEIELFDARSAMGFYLINVLVGATCATFAVFGWGLRYGLPGWIFGLAGPIFAWFGWTRGRRREALEQRAST
jgi:uncharacterized membrane protein